MHNQAIEMAKWAMTDACAKGYDCMTSQDWDDFKDCVETAKNAIKCDYYYRLVECMKKAEEEEKEADKYILMLFKSQYGDDEGKRYYDDWRYKSSGRFAPKGKGERYSRRGYEEPPYYHMTPEYRMSIDDFKEKSAEELRDLDRNTRGVLYFSEPTKDNVKSNESRYDKARRGYEESKMSSDNSPESKKKNMESLDRYMKELAEDITQLIGDMDNSEKTLVKSKVQTLLQKIQ